MKLLGKLEITNRVVTNELTSSGTVLDTKAKYITHAIDSTSAPDTLEILDDSNKVEIRKFSGIIEQGVFFYWKPPDDLANGKLKFRAIYFITEAILPSAPGTDIAFGWSCTPLNEGTILGAVPLEIAYTNYIEVVGTPTVVSQYEQHITNWTAEVNVVGLTGNSVLEIFLIRPNFIGAPYMYNQKIGVSAIEIRLQRLTQKVV